MERALTSTDIRSLRGQRSRAELAALLGVTPLTVYRWELPDDAPESRRPRGKVLRRLLDFMAAEQQGAARGRDAFRQEEGALSLDPEEHARLAPLLHAIDECRLVQGERELVQLLSSGSLSSEAARALATISLAKLHLLLRNDTTSAMTTLLGVSDQVERMPPLVQLELHLAMAFLFGHADGQLFNPGKTQHHLMLAEPLLSSGTDEHRYFHGFVHLHVAAALYDSAVIARAQERFTGVRELAMTPLHRVLLLEADALVSLSLSNVGEAARCTEALLTFALEHELPLQQLRGLAWTAEVLVEQGSSPAEVLALVERAEHIARAHRIADGVHAMLLNRNKGDALMRTGRVREAERALQEAARIGDALSYTPMRIFTSLARLYAYCDRVPESRALAQRCLRADDVQRDLTRVVGSFLALLADVAAQEAPADWLETFLQHALELRRLGAWAVAYRYLALYALSIAARHGSLVEGERVLQVAERAIEGSPSPTASALHRAGKALLLLRRGAFAEGQRLLTAALATFEASGDVPEAALVRHWLASAAELAREPGAAAQRQASADHLRALQLAIPAPLVVEAHAPTAPATLAAQERLHLEDLIVPLQRLSTRGVGASMLQEALIDIAGELFPGRALRLLEIDSAGAMTTLAAQRFSESALCERFDFRDGVGRLLRLEVESPLTDSERAALQLVCLSAALAFEIAGLRGVTSGGTRRASATPSTPPLPDFIAASSSTRRLKAELGRLSASRATIIITGESGTGKEVVARAIHDLSRRAKGPYVTFNSAAVPRELFEGQLFGYKKGAFTGASADHPGVIRAAAGGTLFLDEIGELPLDVQPKLLRFLENNEVLPLGEQRAQPVDVRVIAATHRDLLRLVREGKFREDLYYRLQVVPVHIAPLRERREDIVALTRFFVQKLTPEGREPPLLTPDGEAKLTAHTWPGNVRELRNVVERSLAFDPLPSLLGAAQLRI